MIAEGSYTMEQVFSSSQRWNKESGNIRVVELLRRRSRLTWRLQWCAMKRKNNVNNEYLITHGGVFFTTLSPRFRTLRLNEAPLKPWVIISSNGSVDCAHSDCRWARRIMWTYGYTEDNQHAVLKDHSHLVIHTWCLAPYTQVLTRHENLSPFGEFHLFRS